MNKEPAVDNVINEDLFFGLARGSQKYKRRILKINSCGPKVVNKKSNTRPTHEFIGILLTFGTDYKITA